MGAVSLAKKPSTLSKPIPMSVGSVVGDDEATYRKSKEGAESERKERWG